MFRQGSHDGILWAAVIASPAVSRPCGVRAGRWTGLLITAVLLSALALLQAPSALAQLQGGGGKPILSDDVRAALTRFTDGTQYASETQRLRDQALLFANNDSINAAGLVGEIDDAVYQVAQNDFDQLNTKFGREAATAAQANFTVQARPGDKATIFAPGTDSDYITIVANKHQVEHMQIEYNRRVNAHLQKHGIISEPSFSWHNRLDTDFMADPRFVTEAEFREIAAMNNDAYKRTASADFERISRMEGGGKIGPHHVTDYTADMADFVAKKRGKISEMFQNPDMLKNKKNRAKLIQMMAQEQKYISRMEALDDYLRAQEGLPPRSRGVTTAKQGAVRKPSNVPNIEGAHKVALSSQGTAVDNLVDTMSEIAKTKPDSPFAKTAADDIAKLIAQAPAEHRGAIMAKLGRTNPDLMQSVKTSAHFSDVDDIVRNADKITDITQRGPAAGNMAKAGDSAADAARAADKTGDMARLTDKLSDTAKAGMKRGAAAARAGLKQGVAAFGAAADTLGKIGVGVEVASTTVQMTGLAGQMKEAWDAMNDPNISAQEAIEAFEKLDKMAWDLSKSASFAAALEANPYFAAAFGVVSVACIAGNWRFVNRETGESVGRPASLGEVLTCDTEAHWDKFADLVDHKLSGDEAKRAANDEAVCNKMKVAIAEGRMVPLHENTPEEICAAFKRGGWSEARDMWKRGTPTETAAVDPTEEDEPADRAKSSACQVAENHYATGREAYAQGDVDAYSAALDQVEETLSDAPVDGCSDLTERVAKGREQTEVLGRVKERAGELLAACRGSDPEEQAHRMQTMSRLLARTNQPYVREVKQRLDAAQAATLIYARAKQSFEAGDIEGAALLVPRAEAAVGNLGGGDCPELRNSIRKAPAVIGKWQDAARKIDRTIQSCDQDAMARHKAQLSGLSSNKAIAQVLSARVENAAAHCKQLAAEAAVAREAAAAEDRLVVCKRDYGPGYSVGHVLEDGRFFCVPNKVTADDWCRNKNGSGYYSASIDSRGGFSCLPDQSIANADCQQQYGSGWHADKVKSDGSYTCSMGKSARNAECQKAFGSGAYAGSLRRDGTFNCKFTKAARNAWCKRQNGSGWYAGASRSDGGFNCYPGKSARNANCRARYGRGWYAGSPRKDGSFLCYGPPQVTQRAVPRQPQPRYVPRGPSGAQVGAAIGAAIAAGIIASQRGGGGGGNRRCHRNPNTGQLHCGSN